LKGRNCVITGGTSGIGKATALALGRCDANIIITGRNAARGAAAAADLREQSGNDRIQYLGADLSSQSSIRQLADSISEQFPALHILINSAGVVEPHYRSTDDGIEATLAINHLAPFLLTNLLLPALRAGAPSRIVTVSSQVHSHSIDLDDLQLSQTYVGLEAYRRSKLANILFTVELARRLRDSGVTANCLHPGVVQTRLLDCFGEAQQLEAPLQVNPSPPNIVSRAVDWVVERIRWRLFPSGLSTAEEAAGRLVYLATSPHVEGRSGEYFVDNQCSDPAEIARDRVLVEGLWHESARLVGL
jgi:retinol dehydrogenase-12